MVSLETIRSYADATKLAASCIECPICKEVCTAPIRPKNCAHRYCSDCFKGCYKDKKDKACATCRTPILAVTQRGYTVDTLFEAVAAGMPGIADDEDDGGLDLAAMMEQRRRHEANLRAAAEKLRKEQGLNARANRAATRSRVPPDDLRAAPSGASPAASAHAAAGAPAGRMTSPSYATEVAALTARRSSGRETGFLKARSGPLEEGAWPSRDGGSRAGGSRAGAPPPKKIKFSANLGSKAQLNDMRSLPALFDGPATLAASAAASVNASSACFVDVALVGGSTSRVRHVACAWDACVAELRARITAAGLWGPQEGLSARGADGGMHDVLADMHVHDLVRLCGETVVLHLS